VTNAAVGPLDVPVAYAIAMTVGALVFVPLCIKGIRVLWRRPVDAFGEPLAWWVWGAPLWRGYVRGMAAVGATFVVDLLLILLVIWGPGGDAVLLAIAAALVLSLTAGLVLAVTIALFNRPRWAVPPHLRGQPGAVREWRPRRRHVAGPAQPR
jgi:hypothetical protein